MKIGDLTEAELDSYVAAYVEYCAGKADIQEPPFPFSYWFRIEQSTLGENARYVGKPNGEPQ